LILTNLSNAKGYRRLIDRHISSGLSDRSIPWVCPICRKKEVHPATVHYQAERLHEGRLVAVNITDLLVPQCARCGELVFDYAADEQISEAVKAQTTFAFMKAEMEALEG